MSLGTRLADWTLKRQLIGQNFCLHGRLHFEEGSEKEDSAINAQRVALNLGTDGQRCGPGCCRPATLTDGCEICCARARWKWQARNFDLPYSHQKVGFQLRPIMMT